MKEIKNGYSYYRRGKSLPELQKTEMYGGMPGAYTDPAYYSDV